MKISYDSEDLIKECRADIFEFGENTPVVIWVKIICGQKFITNYDFIEPELPVTEEEIKQGETLETSTLGNVLNQLIKQNAII